MLVPARTRGTSVPPTSRHQNYLARFGIATDGDNSNPIPASQTPVTLRSAALHTRVRVDRKLHGKGGRSAAGGVFRLVLTRSTPTLRPTGTRTGLRLVVRLKP